MDALIRILTEQTQSLKEQYIQLTVEFAENRFNYLMEKLNWSYETWVEHFPRKYTILNKLQVTLSKDGHKFRDEVYSAKRLGKEKYIEKAKNLAESHYENSIYKLADRLTKKGITENFEMKTTHIKNNIETIIDHPKGRTVAYTIIASGPIQRPHYRYLVK